MSHSGQVRACVCVCAWSVECCCLVLSKRNGMAKGGSGGEAVEGVVLFTRAPRDRPGPERAGSRRPGITKKASEASQCVDASANHTRKASGRAVTRAHERQWANHQQSPHWVIRSKWCVPKRQQ